MRGRARRGTAGRGWARTIVALAVALALAVAGCGGDDDETSPAQQGEEGQPTTITVGTLPIIPSAPLFLGIEQGFFEEENLTIETQLAEGGAAIVPGVQSGDIDIGFGNTVSLFLAKAQGLGTKMIAAGQIGPEDPDEDEAAIMVPENSPVRSVEDLEGKTIASNTLNNIGTLSIEAGMDNLGADSDTIELTEVPFPEALAAIDAERVDAAFFSEPFTTLGERAGARTIFHPFAEGVPGTQIGAYFVSERYATENRDVVDRFARAMEKANRYAIDHPDEVRAVVPTYTEVAEDLARDIRLSVWVPRIEPDRLQRLADLALEYGLLEEELDTSELLLE